MTRVCVALVHVLITDETFPAWAAGAAEATWLICACAIVEARARLAVVNVYVTVFPCKPWQTLTLVVVHQVPTGAKLAGFLLAVVDVCLAVNALVSLETAAVVGVIDLLTASPVLTGLLQTLIDVLFTIFPLKSRGTLALVAVDQVDTGGSVLALVHQAVVNIPFTLTAGVSWLAGACVGIYAIYTGAAVLTLNFLEIFILIQF